MSVNFGFVPYLNLVKSNNMGQHIKKTCPCNIQRRLFSVVKLKIPSENKIDILNIFA